MTENGPFLNRLETIALQLHELAQKHNPEVDQKAAEQNPFLGELNQLEPEELLEIGKQVIESPNPQAAFSTLSQKPPKSLLDYYDLVFGPQQLLGNTALALVAQKLNIAHARALDIGCATGLSTLAIAPSCDQVTAVDINASLVKTAEKRIDMLKSQGLIQAGQAIVGNFFDIRFPQELDLTVAQGLDPHLTPQEFTEFHRILFRITSPESIHLRYLPSPDDPSVYNVSRNAKMAGLIAKAIGLKVNLEKEKRERTQSTKRVTYQELGFEPHQALIGGLKGKVLILAKQE